MKLLSMSRSSSSSPTYDTPITLDMLWDQACRLGVVTVERSIMSGQYAQIAFERKSGSRVYAKGFNSDIREALRLAISEAIELGAKP